MALATVPNVGSLVSFVCGQAAALVEKSVLLSRRAEDLCQSLMICFQI